MRRLAVLVAGLLTATAVAERPRPNVLLLVSDDQRPDTIAALGNEHISTPNLDALAKGGCVFSRAICANPICTPSRAEILTGCSGFRNGVLDFGKPIDPDLTPWARAMQSAGYRTGYVGKWHNSGRPSTHGYQESVGLYAGGGGKWWQPQKDHNGREVTGYRGWIFQTDDRQLQPEKGVGLTPDISAKFADSAIEFIARRSEQPFFLHVNFTAPHDPLLMPPGFEDRYRADQLPVPRNFLPAHPFDHGNFDGRDEKLLPWPRTKQAVLDELAVYYAVISHMDQQIGRICDTLKENGQWDNTIVVFTSDHGLGVGSHGLRGKQNMYEHTIGVPLLMRGPGIPAGEQRGAQLYLRDLYPTICDLTGVAIPASVEGKSFAGVIAGKVEQTHPHVFGYFRTFQRMIRTDRWKLIYYPHLDRYQLFDLKHDPFELNDLAAEAKTADVREQLSRELLAWQRQMKDPALDIERPSVP